MSTNSKACTSGKVLKEQNKKKFTQDTLFSKQYQIISEQLI
jgi:hypothetical protein